MRFVQRKRRQPPAIIIVSLIDILIVLLIFMMVTTTFKHQPAVKVTLPESKAGAPGAADTERLVVTLSKEPPHFYLGQLPVTLEKLQAELLKAAAKDPDTVVAVRADDEAAVGRFVKVVDAVKAAGFRKPVSVWTRKPGQK